MKKLKEFIRRHWFYLICAIILIAILVARIAYPMQIGYSSPRSFEIPHEVKHGVHE
jgi:hypothetical protein